VLGAGCWVLGAGCWVLGAGCWVLGAGCWVLGAGCWVLGKDGAPPRVSIDLSKSVGHKKAPHGRGFMNTLGGSLLLVVDLHLIGHFRLWAINQLNIRHRRLVASAVAALEDTDVTTGTLLITRTQLLKQLTNS